MYLDDTGAAYTFLLNPAGGLVGGDEVAVAVKVQPGAHVVISSPSANRVYRSSAAPSIQTVDVHVGSDAILEWVPEVTIPFAGSRFRQVIRAQVDNGGVLLVWDSIASGRIARGERWAFALMENEINLKVGSGSSLVERVRIAPKSDDDARLAEAWDYLASFYLVGDQVSGEAWKHIEVDTVALLEGEPGGLLGGVSQPAAPGLVVKLLARRAGDLARSFEGIWGIARRELWNLPVPALRRY